MSYSVKIHARIGELIQGILPDGGDFLVSGLPSRTLYTEATLDPKSAGSNLPAKAIKALSLLPQAANLPIRLTTNIPPGKGLSSSSTDVLSVFQLASDYLHLGLTITDLYRLAAQVEPTDPCLSDGIVVFRQRSGVVLAEIPLPPLSLIYFDTAPDRQIDTLTLGRHYPPGAPAFFNELLHRFMQAAAEKDIPRLLGCITQSAAYNQSILRLPGFDDYYRLAMAEGAGLTVAHSGTIAGWLTKPAAAESLREKIDRIAKPADIYTEHLTYTYA